MRTYRHRELNVTHWGILAVEGIGEVQVGLGRYNQEWLCWEDLTLKETSDVGNTGGWR